MREPHPLLVGAWDTLPHEQAKRERLRWWQLNRVEGQ